MCMRIYGKVWRAKECASKNDHSERERERKKGKSFYNLIPAGDEMEGRCRENELHCISIYIYDPRQKSGIFQTPQCVS